ncbi:MAG: YdeI/OmpD-associated family protein [Chitinophagales bacterium]|nr:YdeI/OmpD-associated family protein [Chitinophagales bacterium]
MQLSETPDKKELPVLSFKTRNAFDKWLAKNYDKYNGIWLRFFKKASGEKAITYKEALDEALCYGWIDGQANKYDDKSWIQKFTPRRPKSIWSKRNTDHIERLTSLGKMKPSGVAEVEKAKIDGRWANAYDGSSQMQIPEDFMKILSRNKKANTFFKTLNKANKYAISFRLQTAKKPETREKRLKAILEMLSREEKFH